MKLIFKYQNQSNRAAAVIRFRTIRFLPAMKGEVLGWVASKSLPPVAGQFAAVAVELGCSSIVSCMTRRARNATTTTATICHHLFHLWP